MTRLNYLNALSPEEIREKVRQLNTISVREMIEKDIEKMMPKETIENVEVFEKLLVFTPDDTLGMIYKVKTSFKNTVYESIHWYLVVAE